MRTLTAYEPGRKSATKPFFPQMALSYLLLSCFYHQRTLFPYLQTSHSEKGVGWLAQNGLSIQFLLVDAIILSHEGRGKEFFSKF